MDGTFLEGFPACITVKVGSQTGRKKEQASVGEMLEILFRGCVEALVSLGNAAQFVKEIAIEFPPSDGTAYIWPTVTIVSHIPKEFVVSSEVLDTVHIKFESFLHRPRYENAAFGTLSGDDIAERIAVLIKANLLARVNSLRSVSEKIEEAASLS